MEKSILLSGAPTPILIFFQNYNQKLYCDKITKGFAVVECC